MVWSLPAAALDESSGRLANKKMDCMERAVACGKSRGIAGYLLYAVCGQPKTKEGRRNLRLPGQVQRWQLTNLIRENGKGKLNERMQADGWRKLAAVVRHKESSLHRKLLGLGTSAYKTHCRRPDAVSSTPPPRTPAPLGCWSPTRRCLRFGISNLQTVPHLALARWTANSISRCPTISNLPINVKESPIQSSIM